MPRLTLVHSFLDRFEERLQVDCELLKCQLLAQVDQQFGVLRSKVTELRIRFGVDRALTARCVTLLDDPKVETVQLDQWKQEQRAMMESSDNAREGPSTSTGCKRKSNSSTSQSVDNKRHKTVTTAGSNKYKCKSPGCGKSFELEKYLDRHERIHLGMKPFSCTWPGCRYLAERKDNVVRHVRTQHFKLPELKKDQTRLNIVDNRNPQDYIRVDNQLLERRLE